MVEHDDRPAIGGLASMTIRFRGGNRRGVAQPGSASALGAEGRRFESCLPDHRPHAGIREPTETIDYQILPAEADERTYFDFFSVLFSVLTLVLTFTSTSVLPTLFSIFSPVFSTSLAMSAPMF